MYCSTRNAFRVAQVVAVPLCCAFLASAVLLMINGEPHIGTLSIRKQSLCVVCEERLQSLISAAIVLEVFCLCVSMHVLYPHPMLPSELR